jgi:hypothetical protein
MIRLHDFQQDADSRTSACEPSTNPSGELFAMQTTTPVSSSLIAGTLHLGSEANYPSG